MKTEQAIRKLGQTLWDILGREYIDKYCEDKNGNLVSVSSISVEDIAEELVNAGYGDVSEYKAKIEDLKDEIIYLERKIAIRDNALKDRDKAIEMLEGKQDTIVKQAKIDVLNKAKEKFNAISRELGDDCDLCGVSAVCSCRCEINELIKEIENGEDKG